MLTARQRVFLAAVVAAWVWGFGGGGTDSGHDRDEDATELHSWFMLRRAVWVSSVFGVVSCSECGRKVRLNEGEAAGASGVCDTSRFRAMCKQQLCRPLQSIIVLLMMS